MAGIHATLRHNVRVVMSIKVTYKDGVFEPLEDVKGALTDLSSSKRHQALVISPDAFNDQMQDLVVAAITSQLAADHAITIDLIASVRN
jgi:hypothetical protein